MTRYDVTIDFPSHIKLEVEAETPNQAEQKAELLVQQLPLKEFMTQIIQNLNTEDGTAYAKASELQHDPF